jgi:predicted secreted acid phosphatase
MAAGPRPRTAVAGALAVALPLATALAVSVAGPATAESARPADIVANMTATTSTTAAISGTATTGGTATTATTSATATIDATASASYDTWLADVTAVIGPAQTYLKQRLASATPRQKLAIVLDIDNTSLASYFSSTYPIPATPPVLALAKYAAAHGTSVWFVTGRPELIDVATLYNLKTAGYPVRGLYSRDLIELLEPLQTFKTAARKQIESDGYKIIANIGNNTTDLIGGHAERTFKLPDYDGLLD